MSVEAVRAQPSNLAAVSTKPLDSLSPGQSASLTTAVGTLSTSGVTSVVKADSYGGAGGTGSYFAVGSQSASADPVTLTFKGSQSSFGMWWSSADANNAVTLYSGTSALGDLYLGRRVSGPGRQLQRQPDRRWRRVGTVRLR